MKKETSVLVAMSGGVDSSLAAKILKDEGFAVSGMILRLWGDAENPAQKAKMEEAISDAAKMAAFIPGSRFRSPKDDVHSLKLFSFPWR